MRRLHREFADAGLTDEPRRAAVLAELARLHLAAGDGPAALATADAAMAELGLWRPRSCVAFGLSCLVVRLVAPLARPVRSERARQRCRLALAVHRTAALVRPGGVPYRRRIPYYTRRLGPADASAGIDRVGTR